jgi:hypothetical protein
LSQFTDESKQEQKTAFFLRRGRGEQSAREVAAVDLGKEEERKGMRGVGKEGGGDERSRKGGRGGG